MNFRNRILIVPAVILLFSAPLLFIRDHPAATPPEGSTRVVSLSPSITREIVDLGAGGILDGVVNPEYAGLQGAESVGSYLNPDLEKVIRLRPDIVFISEEDIYIQKTALLRDFGLTVVAVGKNPDFDSMCSNYIFLAGLIGKESAALEKIRVYKERVAATGASVSGRRPRIVFLVSAKPLVSVSAGSHISSIIRDAGADNIFGNAGSPYPLLSLEALVASQPDAVIVMSTGDDEYLYSMLSGFKRVRFSAEKNIFIAGDEHIPYYTPADYTASVERIASILKMIKR